MEHGVPSHSPQRDSFPRLPSSSQDLETACQPVSPRHPQVRTDSSTIAGAPVSLEANGALAGELCPRAGPAGRIGVTAVSADVAWVLQGVGGAIWEGRDIETS